MLCSNLSNVNYRASTKISCIVTPLQESDPGMHNWLNAKMPLYLNAEIKYQLNISDIVFWSMQWKSNDIPNPVF